MIAVRKLISSQISNYLDDILIKNLNRDILLRDLSVVQSVLSSLGFIQNLQKSDLVPSQRFEHLGLIFDTHLNRVFLPEKRKDSISSIVNEVMISSHSSPRILAKLVGSLQAATDAVPLGRLLLRPVQWAVKSLVPQPVEDWDRLLLLPTELKSAIDTWTNTALLSSGTPLVVPPPTATLCTDASTMGWGANLSPEFLTVKGVWTAEEKTLHINVLELLAVWRAVSHWVSRLQNSSIMICTDNTSVVAYLKHQGVSSLGTVRDDKRFPYSGRIDSTSPSM